MNILPLIKGATGIAASLGAGAVVGNAIKATTPEGLKRSSKILVGIGSVVLSGIAGDMAAKYIEQQIDSAATGFIVGRNLAKKYDVNVSATPKDPNDTDLLDTDTQ